MSPRRFPPPWSIEKIGGECLVVGDANGQALAYVYFEDETAPAVTEAAVFGFSPKTTPVCGLT
jgi:hypothetical protein